MTTKHEMRPADVFTITYSLNIAAEDAEEAAAEAYRRLTASRGFRAIFEARNNQTGEVSTIDLEAA